MRRRVGVPALCPERTAGRVRSIDDIDSLPGDLLSYYAESLLADHHDPDWGRLRLPLLATLAAAAEPLSVPVLTRLAGLPEEHPVQVLCEKPAAPLPNGHADAGRRFFATASTMRACGSSLSAGPRAADRRRRLQAEEFARAEAPAHTRIVDYYLDAFGGLSHGLPQLAADLSVAQIDQLRIAPCDRAPRRAGRRGHGRPAGSEQPAPGLGSIWYAAHEGQARSASTGPTSIGRGGLPPSAPIRTYGSAARLRASPWSCATS